MISILSIDGGGIKGIISAKVLIRLEKYIKLYTKKETVHLADYFDLIAGTSTGSILAALILCPDPHGRPQYTANDALELYLTQGKAMFQKRFLYPINTFFGLFGSKYKNNNFMEALNQYFGEIKMKQLLKPCLFPAYNTRNQKTIFFNSMSSMKNECRDYYLKDAVLASSAAPTYFPPTSTVINEHCIDCFIDGGVFANNPALCALVEALKLPTCNNIHKVHLLSVGNVCRPDSYPCNKVKYWGIIGWALPLLDILMDASVQTVHYELTKLFNILSIPEQYQRIALITTKKIPAMDDTSKGAIHTLLDFGEQLVDLYDSNIKAYAYKLAHNSIP